MKLWLIKRTDETDWDETNAIVVRAEDEAAARAQALAPDSRFSTPEDPDPVYYGFREDNIAITELTPEGEPGLILRDFLRG